MREECIMDWPFVFDIFPFVARTLDPLIYCPVSSARAFYQQVAEKQLCHWKISLSPVWLQLRSVMDSLSWTVSPSTSNRGSSCPWLQLRLSLRVSKIGIASVIDAQLEFSWVHKSLEICLVFLIHLWKSMYRRFTQMEKVVPPIVKCTLWMPP